MSVPLRILFIAHSFPPSTEIGGARVVGLCSYLPEFGIAPVVLTVQNRFHARLDHTMSIPSPVRVIRTAQQVIPLDWYAMWKSRQSSTDVQDREHKPNVSTEGTAPIRSWYRKFLPFLLIPDKYWGWYLPARRTGRHLLQGGEFDAIISKIGRAHV